MLTRSKKTSLWCQYRLDRLLTVDVLYPSEWKLTPIQRTNYGHIVSGFTPTKDEVREWVVFALRNRPRDRHPTALETDNFVAWLLHCQELN